ncbi:hypothetical protein [Kosakonia sp. MH5]|uniref:hypothetical protein n=1 Tax=Kosakonia sp. MH5 TaxID=2202822 RepID=UPI001374CBF4|nr:hypothetical protein [Kosakonia sp. MH5]NCF07965.1 hypothetical protein [Kosakonia sp. MH5]
MYLFSKFPFLKMAALSAIFVFSLTSCNDKDFLVKEALIPAAYLQPPEINKKNDSKLPEKSGGLNAPFLCLDNTQQKIKVCSNLESSFKSDFLRKEDGNFKSLEYVRDFNNPGDILNVVNVPESEPEWISIFISILALIASGLIPFFQHRVERSEEINDGYWFREVILPKINGLAFEVYDSFKGAMKLDEATFINEMDVALLPKLGELSESLYLLNTFSSMDEKIEELQTICDKLELDVSLHLDASLAVRVNDVFLFHAAFIKALIKLHKKIN